MDICTKVAYNASMEEPFRTARLRCSRQYRPVVHNLIGAGRHRRARNRRLTSLAHGAGYRMARVDGVRTEPGLRIADA